MEAVGLLRGGRGDNGQVLIAATSEQPEEEGALHPGPCGVRGRWSRGLLTNGKLMRRVQCMK